MFITTVCALFFIKLLNHLFIYLFIILFEKKYFRFEAL